MSRETAMPGSGYRHNRQPRQQQMDMFGSGLSNGVIDAPAWPELPAEARAALTRLAAEAGEIEAFHPLSDGPWIFVVLLRSITAAQFAVHGARYGRV
jgi:hypothetical protein